MITEQQATQLGFELYEEFPHDQFKTRRFKYKFVIIEFTYEKTKLVSTFASVPELFCNNPCFSDICTYLPLTSNPKVES